MDQSAVKNKLRDHGYKLTNQRIAIIDVLFEQRNQFLSAEEIYIKAKEKYSQTNFSTIYRNLEILDKIGILHKTHMDKGSSCYGLICQDDHHHHIICRGCGKTESIDFCPYEQMKHKLSSRNFKLTDHKFELYGYCWKCQPPSNS